ncbi:hypothetical protein NIES2101_41540 [Calothrix sp. HK-06]|nr:hypothetical protein NIES2101_41540 [Calothrix sp. HK-06]
MEDEKLKMRIKGLGEALLSMSINGELVEVQAKVLVLPKEIESIMGIELFVKRFCQIKKKLFYLLCIFS